MALVSNIPGVGQLESAMRGWPDNTLSAALIVVAIVTIVAAIMAPATVKLAILAWVLFP